MRIQDHPPLHLTYCLNVHPGESWAENFQAIRGKALAVRDRVAPAGVPFGLGLRLSRRAADELAAETVIDEFREFLAANGLYVFTVNGFPYGPFHGTAVKQDVYRPDWRDVERRDYTMTLAEVLRRLLPEGVGGSISTVPGSYKAWARSEGDAAAMAANLCDVAARLDAIRQESGRWIVLALEPEPDCSIETTEEAVRFFEGPLRGEGRRRIERAHGRSASDAEEIVRRHVGVCLDLAHAAVEFEDPLESLRRFEAAGIVVGKVQLSAALAAEPTPEALARLREFRDPVYLHQVKVRRPDGRIEGHPDLPNALDCPGAQAAGAEWRVHFHVPLFCDRYGPLRSTAALPGPEFWRRLRAGACPHLEIETYTFAVLPEGLRSADVVENVVREYAWAMGKLTTG